MSTATRRPRPEKQSREFDLDELLTIPDGALWLKMDERTLKENIRLGRIPIVRINARVFRLHPRSVLAKLAERV